MDEKYIIRHNDTSQNMKHREKKRPFTLFDQLISHSVLYVYICCNYYESSLDIFFYIKGECYMRNEQENIAVFFL